VPDSVASASPLRKDPATHPAAVAWTRATGGPEPREIRAFRDRKGPALGNAAIYWLDGADPDGGAVIAKLNRRLSAEVEHAVYCDLLPRLPVSGIRCLGRVDEDAEHTWLFLECAEGERYSPALARHRETAGSWLGALHASASSLAGVPILPERGLLQFLDRTRSAKTVLSARAQHPGTSAEVREVLEAAIAELSRLEERWDEVTAACSEQPRTLVHGDFGPPNLRLGPGPGAPRLLAFDWEEAGWGSAAVDLARVVDPRHRIAANPCLESYRRAAAEHGMAPEPEALRGLAEVGRVLRCVSAIHWLSMELGIGDRRLSDIDSRPVLKLKAYLSWLAGPKCRKRQPKPSPKEEKLRRLLESEVLPRVRGDQTSIAELRSVPSPSATSYAAQVVTVGLSDGATLRMFLKDFGSSRLFKDDPGDRRARELHVYRDLLPDGELDIPAYYGAVWGQQHQRFWMVLEFVTGVPVADCEFDSWSAATAWLARMQGLFARDPDRFERSPLLVRHDADLFASRAERALSSARQISARAARRLRGILSGYDDFVSLMADQPSTFVHGSYRPENVLIEEPARPSRVCVVDWELAAIGSPLYDLSRLCDGYRGARLDRLLDSYRREAAAHGVPVPDRERMVEVLDCFALQRVVNAISHAHEKGRTQRQVSDWLGYGETVRARLP
jgi:aminoglycoside phosphotransferase (APT) family kinase protein